MQRQKGIQMRGSQARKRARALTDARKQRAKLLRCRTPRSYAQSVCPRAVSNRTPSAGLLTPLGTQLAYECGQPLRSKARSLGCMRISTKQCAARAHRACRGGRGRRPATALQVARGLAARDFERSCRTARSPDATLRLRGWHTRCIASQPQMQPPYPTPSRIMSRDQHPLDLLDPAMLISARGASAAADGLSTSSAQERRAHEADACGVCPGSPNQLAIDDTSHSLHSSALSAFALTFRRFLAPARHARLLRPARIATKAAAHTAHARTHARKRPARTLLRRGARARALRRGGLGAPLLGALRRRHMRGVVVVRVLRHEQLQQLARGARLLWALLRRVELRRRRGD